MIRVKRIFSAAAALVLSVSFALAVRAETVGEVILGGSAFGVRLYDDRLIAVSLEEVRTKDGALCPAADAGVLEGDEIVAVNGEKVTDAVGFVRMLEKTGGAAVTLTVRRGDETREIAVTPAKSAADGKPRLGICVKDSTAGIGTMTFVCPDTLAFGALGHGIGGSDEKGGEDAKGAVYEVEVTTVRRGESGSPGELGGTFGNDKIGSVTENCPDGLFGVCSALPSALDSAAMTAVCPAAEVREGAAKLYCTLGDDGVRAYDVTISDISGDVNAERSFVVTVADRELIARTGGIVQGMSGSPLVQDGRIIGAVTHVLVSDPTSGYGIFIEKMLDELPDVLANGQ